MADKPILFSGPMVKALLAGTKTQTRRVIQNRGAGPQFCGGRYDDRNDPECWGWEDFDRGEWITLDQWKHWSFVPYRTGDRLYVREAFAISGIGWGKKPADAIGGRVHYRADPDHGWHDYWGSWRPSIHMPRWASRLTLTVTDVRVQRIQDISEADAIAEGIEPEGGSDCDFTQFHARKSFEALWDSLNAARGYGWDVDPWVVAYTFTVAQQNIDD